MAQGTFRPRWKKGLRGPQPMCCQHIYIIYVYFIAFDHDGEKCSERNLPDMI